MTETSTQRRQRHTCYQVEEEQLLEAVTKHFCRSFGKEVAPARIYMSDEFMLIRTGNLLGVAEKGLLEAENDGDHEFVRTMKLKLVENTLPGLVSGITIRTGVCFRESFLSYSTRDDEMVVFLNRQGGEKR